jgi:hypothetical protein
MTMGILAFGSLLEDPGDELWNATAACRDGFTTPFRVEFAHESSRTRGGAPTLVPFNRGAHIAASVLVLDSAITENHAKGILYRRETRNVGAPDADAQSKAWIEALHDFGGVDATPRFRRTSSRCPQPAWSSWRHTAPGAPPAGRTATASRPHSCPEYEAQILAQSDATDLADAWERARNQG